MRLAVVALAIPLAVTACGGDGSSLDSGSIPQAAQLAFTVQPSAATAGQPITPAIQVSVQDTSGSPVTSSDTAVTLALALHSPGATLSGTTTVNARGGVATFSDLRVTKPGTGFVLSASAQGLISAVSTGFDISPVPGVAVAIAPAGGDHQTATVNSPVAINPSVKVTDGLGNPAANVAITFSVTDGGGSATGLDQTTDSAGLATVGQWTLGTTAELNRLLATSPAVEGSSVTFTATATPGSASALAKFFGDSQVTNVGSTVAAAPSVLVTDEFGNPVGGVPVTFTVESGGGSVTGGAQTTGVNGVAAVGSWKVGNHAGRNTLRATSPGLEGSPVTFTATADHVTAVIEVRNNYFHSMRNGSGSGISLFGSAAVDTIPLGGTVLWQWVGENHNVTAFIMSGTHSAPFTLGPITFKEPGTYYYRCTNHSQTIEPLGLVGMRGYIVVR